MTEISPIPMLSAPNAKKIVDPDLESLIHMEKEVANETDFKILTHELDFLGICRDCTAKSV